MESEGQQYYERFRIALPGDRECDESGNVAASAHTLRAADSAARVASHRSDIEIEFSLSRASSELSASINASITALRLEIIFNVGVISQINSICGDLFHRRARKPRRDEANWSERLRHASKERVVPRRAVEEQVRCRRRLAYFFIFHFD